jgi:UDP-glucose 4-epimerase
MNTMKILVTGGAGYIGSHTTLELLNEGYEVTVIDNLSNSKETSLKRVEEITGKKITFIKLDLLNRDGLEKLFSDNTYDAVIHFAGYKAVGESVKKPLMYYENNITGTLNLLEAMGRHSVKRIIFSSSATVYGDPKKVPVTEESEIQEPASPYGKTKLMIEWILKDLYASDNSWSISILRYFNPIGAHPSGKIGEDPFGIPNNLLPYIAQVAVGRLEKLSIFGDDYPTPDGTCIRDYIHVVDLAQGHVKALEKFTPGAHIYNLGTGHGVSVFEMVKAFSKACGKEIPYIVAPRRAGDVPQNFADPAKAEKELGWKATRTIDEMCADVWRWQSQNPKGYEE